MSFQLDMFGILEPKPAPRPYVPPVTRDVETRAYGGSVLAIEEGQPDPVEIDVDGTPCVIKFGFGWSTYVVNGPGSLFWSETGFRSFATGGGSPDEIDQIREAIRRYIAAPPKDGNGMGGKLVPWWPSYINQWRNSLAFELRCPREDTWAQWGPEKHAECWADHDAKQAEAIAQMEADGIDPNDVGPPAHFKGQWPTFGPDLFNRKDT
ncbi:hypothetical protein A8B82_15160 [Sulfitobacter sp. EhC04]|uniref:hypothetical protein n=1 Tax=Sulfitobacter sp. EhC04 TaxID=1849168 RepID=UPI0007F51C4C|nr:hypothetical protein [Sulfitobacter sp. EhC04]OAN76731.1 hypothetical protein A8B82_15160 [Sulfitobacter sp. EhC04]